MDSRVLFATILMMIVAITTSLGADDGKYRLNQFAKKGQYVHTENGKYADSDTKWRYVHVHDQREKGKYIHVHIPYDGGYGPYSHIDNPYKHIDNPYLHDIEPKGEYSQLDPFRTDVYYLDRPDVYQEYGFPHHDPFASDSKISGNLKTTVSPSATETIFVTSTEKSSNLEDRILLASANSKGRIDPFGTNIFNIEKPTISQEYGFPNHDPKISLQNSKDSRSDGKRLGLDIRFSGSSSTLGSSKTNTNSQDETLRLLGNSDPFKTSFFHIDKPKIPQEYGFPNDPVLQSFKERIAPSATEVIFTASSATERSPPRRNVEILREGRSKIPRSEEQREQIGKS